MSRRSLALLFISVSAGCLLAAFCFPFMHAELSLEFPPWVPDPIASRARLWLVDRARLPVGDHYLWGIIRKLFGAREYFVGSAILLFSVVFPIVKITLSGILATDLSVFSTRARHLLHEALSVAGRWSMADVFIVGMIIVFFKAEGLHFSFEARTGVYLYAIAALLSSLSVGIVRRLWDAKVHLQPVDAGADTARSAWRGSIRSPTED